MWKTIAPKGEEGSAASSPGGDADQQEHTTRGTGNTRKLAKNAAADAMLVELGIHPKQISEDAPDKADDPLRRQLRDALEKLHQRQMRSSGLVPPFLGLVHNALSTINVLLDNSYNKCELKLMSILYSFTEMRALLHVNLIY